MSYESEITKTGQKEPFKMYTEGTKPKQTIEILKESTETNTKEKLNTQLEDTIVTWSEETTDT